MDSSYFSRFWTLFERGGGFRASRSASAPHRKMSCGRPLCIHTAEMEFDSEKLKKTWKSRDAGRGLRGALE